VSWDSSLLFRDCPWCGLRHAQFHGLGDPEMPAPRHRKGPRYWTFIGCPQCGGFVALEGHGPKASATAPRREYPEAGADIRVGHLPDDVAEFYAAAIRVLDAGVPDAAAVQLRRTLEAAAARHGVTTGPLVKRIEKLIEKGLITNEFARVLDHIRKVGNVGAHATDERVDEETARRALLFTTQVLRNLFEIPAELEALGDSVAAQPE
jgi:hypothetical protein